MSDEHIETLFRARNQIIQWRRKVAADIAELGDLRDTDKAAALVTFQQALEAIESAIRDEEALRPR